MMFQASTPVDLPPVTVSHRTDLTVTAGLKAPPAGRESSLGVSCGVKPVSGSTVSVSISTTIPHDEDEAEDQELHLLLNLQKPVTERPSGQSHTTADDVLNNTVQGMNSEHITLMHAVSMQLVLFFSTACAQPRPSVFALVS